LLVKEKTMLKLFGKPEIALLCGLIVMQPIFASSCSTWSYTTTPTLGTSNAVDTSSNPGTYFYYYDNSGGEFTSDPPPYDYLPADFYVLNINGSGGFYNGEGGFSNPATFPAGNGTTIPYALNPSATVGAYPNIKSINTSCVPGTTCAACEAASPGSHGYYDCTGRPIAKAPALGLQSPAYNSVTGFNVKGYFLGAG
jgi:hypothetical protein